MPKGIMKKCQGLSPRGDGGFKPCESRAEWVASHNEHVHFCCDEHLKSFLSDETMNIVLPLKAWARIKDKE